MAGQPQKYAGTVLAFGERATINQSLSRYLAATGGTSLASELAVVVPLQGKLKNLRWSAAASGLTAVNNSITVYVNGAATPLIAAWNGAVLSGGNSTTEVQVLAGDRVGVRIQLNAGGTSITRPRVSVELEVDSASRWLADDPNDSNSNIYYVGGGNVGIGTDTPGEKLSVGGIIESGTGGFKFPDGTLQTTASGGIAGGTNALTGAGGAPPNAVWVDGNGRVGIGLDPGRSPQEKLTLAPDSNLAIEMAAPTGVAIQVHAQGLVPQGDYFFRVAASDGTGWSQASSEYSVTLSAVGSCRVVWAPVPGAKLYYVLRATVPGGPYRYHATSSNAFVNQQDADFPISTEMSLPTETTAYVSKLSSSGPSWVLGGSVGIGTSSPQAKLDVSGDIRLQAGAAVSEFSTDQALSDDSDSAVPTERAVRGYVDNLLAGSVTAFAMQQPPVGWLECNGQALSRTGFARLFNRIGTTFGAPDGTTFNVPDLRGEFIRGWDNDRGVDPGRMLGIPQGDLLLTHTHNAWQPGRDDWVQGSGGTQVAKQADNVPTSGNNGPAGSETRPRNIALMYCIKH